MDCIIRVRKREKCPHCGCFVPGDVISEMEFNGPEAKPIIDAIGYDYNGFMRLSKEQSDCLILELKKVRYQNYQEYAQRCIKAEKEFDYIFVEAW